MAKGKIKPKNFNQKIVSDTLTSEIATREFALGAYPGFFNFLPDPDPILRRLGKDQIVYKDLLADDQVGPLAMRRKNLTKSLEWNVEQNDAGDPEVELCELALETLEANGCKIKDIISQSLNAVLFGYTVIEINFKFIEGKWLPVGAWEKPREWFHFDSENRLRFRTVHDYEGEIIIGKDADPTKSIKFILIQNEPTYENPYGDKALSRCFWPVTFKRGGMKFFATFVEKYGMPHIFGKLPRGAKQEEHEDLLDKLSKMIQDAVGTGPDDSSLEVHQVGDKSSADIYDMFLDRCDNAITKAILYNALSTETQGTGTYASSKTGADVIEKDISESDRDFPTAFFNELFKRIIDINLGSGLYPTFGFVQIEESKKDFADRDKTLSEAFSVSGQKIKRTKEFLINRYNYEEDEFELVDTPVSDPLPLIRGGAGVGLNEPPPQPDNEFSSWRKFWNKLLRKDIELADQKKMTYEMLADALPEKLLQFQAEETLRPVIELAKNSTSFDEFKTGLAAQFPKMETRQLEDLAAKVFFIADIEGSFNAQE